MLRAILWVTIGGKLENKVVDSSKAMRLARRICAEWLEDFTTLVPRPVDEVIRLLQQLQRRSEADKARTLN